MYSPLNRIRKRIRWLQESPTGFLKVFERDEWGKKVKSRSVSGTQLKPRWVSPSWCRGCCALRGKSLDRRRWSAVMGLPSAVHVHSHGRSYTEIAAEWGRWHGYSRRLHLFARWVKSWRARLKVDHLLTQNACSKSCEQKVTLLALDTKWFLGFG